VKTILSSLVMFVFLSIMSGCEGMDGYTEITVIFTNTSTEDVHMWANYEKTDISNRLKPGVKREKVFTYQAQTGEDAVYTIIAYANKIDGKVVTKNFEVTTHKPADQIKINFNGVSLVQAD